MAKTSQQWWNEIKCDEKRFNAWLIKQYRGEVTAAQRISMFADAYAQDVKQRSTLNTIARQEETHAEWVLQLLKTRGIVPEVKDAEKRYWQEVLPNIESLETGAAVGAHAEKMRLERIQVIADDASAPDDIRQTFARILKDELFHEKAFRTIAGPDAMSKVEASHRRGRELLGLEP